jgi:hypothetical protein
MRHEIGLQPWFNARGELKLVTLAMLGHQPLAQTDCQGLIIISTLRF